MIERALDLMPPDFPGEARLLSDYGLALGVQEGDDNGAQAALTRASTIARRDGDVVLEILNLCNAARVDGHLAAEADAHHQAANHLISLGDPEAARHHVAAMSGPAEKAADTYSTLNTLLNNIRLSLLLVVQQL